MLDTIPTHIQADISTQRANLEALRMDQATGASRNIDMMKVIIITCVVCSISLSPLTIHLTNSWTNGDDFQEDLFVYITLLSLCSVIVYLTYRILKQHCPISLQAPDRQVKSILRGVFSSHASEIEDQAQSPNKSKQGNTNRRPKIDPKYFKPKYIINELITIWGTTYTVITWGSVWVIGGTIVATERLAQKIKTKCTNPHNNGTNQSRGTGRNESFSSYDSNESYVSESVNDKSSYRRVTSWARKSYANARKRLNRFMNSGVPQLTDRLRS